MGFTFILILFTFAIPSVAEDDAPSFGEPFVFLNGSEWAYIKCDVKQNNCDWNFLGAYYGKSEDDMMLAGSDKCSEDCEWAVYQLRYLEPETTYYYKFFISTSDKTYFSEVKSFKTLPANSDPTFSEPYLTKLDKNSAYVKCSVFKNGFSPNEVGVYLGENADDLKFYGKDPVGKLLTWAGYTIKNLEQNTTYYYRFYVKSNDKTYWGDIGSFKTLHDHIYYEKSIEESTCKNAGTKLFLCQFCDDNYTEELPLKEHKYNSTVIKPTYFEKGYTLKKCVGCEKSIKENYVDKLNFKNVSGLKLSKITSNSVTLNWNKTAEASGYYVYKYNSSSKNWSKIKTLSAKSNSYCIKNLQAGKVQTFAVKAYKTKGKLEVLSPKYVSLKASARPCAVKSFKIKSTTENSISMTWRKVKDVDGYLIYYYDSSKKIYKKQVLINKNSTISYTAKKLKSGSKYQYIIYTLKNLGNGQYVQSEKCLKISAATKPKAVNFKLTQSKGKVKLNWSKVSGATGYKAYYKTSKKGSYKLFKNTKKLNCEISGLKKKKTYYFKVVAYKTVDKKDYSSDFATKSIKIK